MRGFSFSLAKNTFLREDPEGYFLVSRVPVKILRLNESLYLLLKQIAEGGDLDKYIRNYPVPGLGEILRVLLSMVSRGYLRLERIAELETYPKVSVIIPVRDQHEELMECVKSLILLDYPKDKIEIIVVDDGSKRPVLQVPSPPDTRIIRHTQSRGPAAARNTGAVNARGEILAFIDADCVAGKDWLRELVPFLQVARIGAVGGFVAGYYRKSFLDRYEEVCSPLNTGRRLIIETEMESTFYVPTANLLIRRDVFMSTGGFNAELRIGEDVDLCWSMRNLGHTLLYVPFANIAHKHRNRLRDMLSRRARYGTSEPYLYSIHDQKRKNIVVSVYTGISFLALTLVLLLMNPYPLAAIVPLLGIDMFQKSASLRRLRIPLALNQLTLVTLRSYFSLFYYALFHIVRYYWILLVLFGLAWAPFWYFGGLALLYTSLVDYYVKKPKLIYPVFLYFYLLEHLAYQLGVFWGCLTTGYFGSYRIAFRRP